MLSVLSNPSNNPMPKTVDLSRSDELFLESYIRAAIERTEENVKLGFSDDDEDLVRLKGIYSKLY